jgi:glycine cleavage system aminomethyltransferase T
MSGALDFLSPSLARDDGPFRPVARSAVEKLYEAVDATFEERDGWRVAAAVPGEADVLPVVGIADVSHVGKLEVRPCPAPEAVAGGEDVQGSVASVYRLSPRRALALFAESARSTVLGQIAGAELVVDVTAAYSVLAVSGPEARTLIGRLTHLHHFPSGGEVAHVTAHVLPAGKGFRIVVAQELGHYLAEVALDCARALGGGLVGVDALPEAERP